jgi:general secretion pathway protein K
MKIRSQNTECRPSGSGDNRLLTLNQRGSALIVTLLIVTILISLTVEFAYDVYIDTSAVSNWKNAQKASLIAKSGQTVSSSFLKEVSLLTYTYPGEIYLPVSHDFGPNAFLTVKIEDENARFNINSIVYQNGRINDTYFSVFQKLFEYLNINPNLVPSITDWIDPDHESRLPGSEYNAKNNFLWSIEELRLIKGIDSNTFEILSPYLTVHSDNNININTAQLPVLMSLHKDMTETLAQRIIDYRENTPFEFATDLQKLSGMNTIGQAVLGYITIKSSSFKITSTAEVNSITRIIESVMDEKVNITFWREA